MLLSLLMRLVVVLLALHDLGGTKPLDLMIWLCCFGKIVVKWSKGMFWNSLGTSILLNLSSKV